MHRGGKAGSQLDLAEESGNKELGGPRGTWRERLRQKPLPDAYSMCIPLGTHVGVHSLKGLPSFSSLPSLPSPPPPLQFTTFSPVWPHASQLPGTLFSLAFLGPWTPPASSQLWASDSSVSPSAPGLAQQKRAPPHLGFWAFIPTPSPNSSCFPSPRPAEVAGCLACFLTGKAIKYS